MSVETGAKEKGRHFDWKLASWTAVNGLLVVAATLRGPLVLSFVAGGSSVAEYIYVRSRQIRLERAKGKQITD